MDDGAQLALDRFNELQELVTSPKLLAGTKSKMAVWIVPSTLFKVLAFVGDAKRSTMTMNKYINAAFGSLKGSVPQKDLREYVTRRKRTEQIKTLMDTPQRRRVIPIVMKLINFM